MMETVQRNYLSFKFTKVEFLLTTLDWLENFETNRRFT